MKAVRRRLSALFPYKSRLAVQISLSSFIARLVPGRMQRNIAFFHIGRSGSTVLAGVLSQHSKLNARGEIFHNNTPWVENGRLKYGVSKILLFQRFSWLMRSTIVEIKFSKFDDLVRIGMGLDKLVYQLKQAGYAHFIILERRNKLRHQVSLDQGNIRGQWHYSAQAKVPQVQVYIEPRELIKKIVLREREYSQLRRLLKEEDTLEIFYEDDILPDIRGTYEKVCDWLGIRPEDYIIETKRLNTLPLNQSISNYDEVVQALESTEYEWMLEKARID